MHDVERAHLHWLQITLTRLGCLLMLDSFIEWNADNINYLIYIDKCVMWDNQDRQEGICCATSNLDRGRRRVKALFCVSPFGSFSLCFLCFSSRILSPTQICLPITKVSSYSRQTESWTASGWWVGFFPDRSWIQSSDKASHRRGHSSRNVYKRARSYSRTS